MDPPSQKYLLKIKKVKERVFYSPLRCVRVVHKKKVCHIMPVFMSVHTTLFLF